MKTAGVTTLTIFGFICCAVFGSSPAQAACNDEKVANVQMNCALETINMMSAYEFRMENKCDSYQKLLDCVDSVEQECTESTGVFIFILFRKEMTNCEASALFKLIYPASGQFTDENGQEKKMITKDGLVNGKLPSLWPIQMKRQLLGRFLRGGKFLARPVQQAPK